MVLGQQAVDDLAKAGWKFTSYEASELGRRNAFMYAGLQKHTQAIIIPPRFKLLGIACTSVASALYPPAWIATSFLAVTLFKDLYFSVKKSTVFADLRFANEAVFLLHETMTNVRKQEYTLSTSNRTEVSRVVKQYLRQWAVFSHLAKVFKQLCPEDQAKELKAQKKTVVAALEKLQTACKGKKVKKFETALKAATTALKALTEPQNPRGALTKIVLNAESAANKALQALKTALA